MAKICKIAGILLICCVFHGCGSQAKNNNSVVNISSGTEKTEVIIIGTIHDRHYENPHYSPEVLRDIVLSLKQDAILNELPLSQVDPNGRPIYREHDKDPEGWASDTVAKQLGIKQIPFDQPDREQNYKRTDYFRRRKEAFKKLNNWGDELSVKEPNCVDLQTVQLFSSLSQAQKGIDALAEPMVINSVGYDSMIRAKHSVYRKIIPDILKKYERYRTTANEFEFIDREWQQRNEAMVKNIIKIASEYRGKRLVVLTGSEHRYILRDLLKNEKSIEIKEYWQIDNNQ